MKLFTWLKTDVHFIFINRWKDWWGSNDYFCIYFGMEVKHEDNYERFKNVHSFNITICNFGFKIEFRGKPFGKPFIAYSIENYEKKNKLKNNIGM